MNKRWNTVVKHTPSFLYFLYEKGLIKDLAIDRRDAFEYFHLYKKMKNITNFSMSSVVFYLKTMLYGQQVGFKVLLYEEYLDCLFPKCVADELRSGNKIKNRDSVELVKPQPVFCNEGATDQNLFYREDVQLYDLPDSKLTIHMNNTFDNGQIIYSRRMKKKKNQNRRLPPRSVDKQANLDNKNSIKRSQTNLKMEGFLNKTETVKLKQHLQLQSQEKLSESGFPLSKAKEKHIRHRKRSKSKNKVAVSFTNTETYCSFCGVGFPKGSAPKHYNSFKHSVQEQLIQKRFTLVDELEGIVEDCSILKCSWDSYGAVELEASFHFCNFTGENFDLLDVIFLNPVEDIKIERIKSTSLLFGRNTKVPFKIHCKDEKTFHTLAVVFIYADSRKSMTEVLKKLIIDGFNMCLEDSGIVEGEFLFHESNEKVVSGRGPVKASGKSVVPMGEYDLPQMIKNLLARNLKIFPEITFKEEHELKKIKQLLNVPDPKKCLREETYCDILRLLLYMEEFKVKIDLKKYNLKNQHLFVPTNAPKYCLELKVADLAESRPSPIIGDSVFVKEDEKRFIRYEGVVHKVKADSVLLGFSRSFLKKVYSPEKTFSVYFGINRRTFQCEHQAIELIQKHKVSSLFFPKIVSNRGLDNLCIQYTNQNICNNREQQQAVKHVLSGTSWPAPYLIFGPPGTGKTMTLVEAIYQVYSLKKESKIIICAPSNSAVDELTKRLVAKSIPNSDLFRWISFSHAIEAVPPEIVYYSNINRSEGLYYQPDIREVLRFRIIATTLVNAARLVNGGTPMGHFSHVFIDESGHAKESETLIPIAGILTSFRNLEGQIVLAGDPQQLGPIINSDLAKNYGFDISMLERLMNTNDIYKRNHSGQYNPNMLTKLLKNYRSHPAILEIPNRLFYHNELQPCEQYDSYSAIGWKYLKNKKVPIIFHSVMGVDQKESNSPSFFNPDEVKIVINYVKILIGRSLNNTVIREDLIGIITPYRKQVEKIRNECRKIGCQNITIGSVENYQGQERLVIIMSTVRSQQQYVNCDQKFRLGFLKNPKRFNVSITRAKALLIVIGNPYTLQYDDNWREFLKFCIENDCMVGEDFKIAQHLDYENCIVNNLESLVL